MSIVSDRIHTCPHCGCKIGEEREKSNEEREKPSFHNIAARILARHLSLSMNIKQGKELVPLIGETGVERDNLEALTSWIRHRIGEVDRWPIPGTQAVRLANALEQELKVVIRSAEQVRQNFR